MSAITPMIVIESIRIRGFRSLEDVDLSGLGAATVLIGPNGSGKSNVLRFLGMLPYILWEPQHLASYIERQGGYGPQLFGDRDTTQMEGKITLKAEDERYDYAFALKYEHPNQFRFGSERFRERPKGCTSLPRWEYLNGQRDGRNLDVMAASYKYGGAVLQTLRDCFVYQFHNTDARSSIKSACGVSDFDTLSVDGGNLAAILYRLEWEDRKRYERICRYIGRILPGFERFDFEERGGQVSLRWRADWSSRSFEAHLTSDGSLRTFALVTLLNLPAEMLPGVVLLDEPELGLHPAAVTLIGGMIRSLSAQRQVIVATQSPLLVDSFDLEQIHVLELREGRTEVRKFAPSEYEQWLEEYSTGELWQRNLLGGRP